MARILVKPHSFGLQKESGIVVVDKKGLHVDEKTPSYECDDLFIRELIRQAIDTPEWSHSWHLDISKAKIKGSDDRKAVAKVISKRITNLEETLALLRMTKTVLGRWHY
jgi:hypothetical protein